MPTKKKSKSKTKRKPNPAFMRPLLPSKILAEIVGVNAIPRTEVVKRLWAYIRKHKLQDRVKKQFIKADDALKQVFGGKARVSMFEMSKLISKHLK